MALNSWLGLSELSSRWRASASELRRYGAEEQATALEACAAELELAEREYWFEELTLEQAAEELGVSYDTVGRRVARGDIPNAGKKNRPRVRRTDLRGVASRSQLRTVPDLSEPDIAELVLQGGL